MNQIYELLKERKYEEALPLIEKALEEDPNNAKLWGYKGVALRNTGKPHLACPCYEKALEINPEDPDMWLNRGMSIRFMNRKDSHLQAVESYQNAVKYDPTCVDALNNLGNVTSRIAFTTVDREEAAKWYKMSEEAYGKAVSLQPDRAELHCNMAVLYHKEGRLNDALAEAAAAIAIDPDYQDGWYTKGCILSDLHDDLGAIEAYNEVVKRSPKTVTALKTFINLGVSLFLTGNTEKAIVVLKDASVHTPEGFNPMLPLMHANAYYNLALIYKRTGREKESKEAFKKSLECTAKGELFYDIRKEATSPYAAVFEHFSE